MSTSSETIAIQKRTVVRALAGAGSLAIIVLLALVILNLVRLSQPSDSLASAINSGEYQAVFLVNGQVYFGRLSAPGGDFYYLKHVYYLQSQASPQSGKPVRQTLAKLGREIHAPEDLMVLNRAQISFVENLKPSGQVSRAIQSQGGH